MARTVAVNGRTVVHKQSEGVSIAAFDVCLTAEGVPVPFVNVAFSKDAAAEASSVFCDGCRVMKASSYLATSTGDEPGVLGGVISGRNMGKASFVNYSFDVFVEGEPVPRNLDPMVHNHGSPGQAHSPELLQSGLSPDDAKVVLCKLFCFCQATMGYTSCIHEALAHELPFSGSGSKYLDSKLSYFDPKYKGLYVEVPFSTADGSPRMMVDGDGQPIKECRHPGETRPGWGDIPLPMPQPRFPQREAVVPDVVLADDPNYPLSKNNLGAIYEAKFRWAKGEDKLTEAQARYLKTLVPANRLYILDNAECGCDEEGEPMPPDESGAQEAKDAVVAGLVALFVVGLLVAPVLILEVAGGTGALGAEAELATPGLIDEAISGLGIELNEIGGVTAPEFSDAVPDLEFDDLWGEPDTCTDAPKVFK